MDKRSLKPLIRILKQFAEYYPLIIVYSACISFLTLATPISVQSLVNTFSFGPFFQPIFILSLILLTLLGVLGALKCLQYLVVEYLQRKIYAKVTASISRAYFIGDEVGSVEIDNKANRYLDVVLIHKTMSLLITDGIAIILQTFLGLILLCFYNPFFIAFSLILLASIIGPIYFFGRKSVESAVDESTAKYSVADYIKDLAGHKNDKLNLIDKLKLTDHHIDVFLQNRSVHFKDVFIQNILYILLYAFLNALLLALGGYLVISNQLSVGQLVAAEIVVNAIVGKFLVANKYLEGFYDIVGASHKIHAFYDFIDKYRAETKHDSENHSPLYSHSSREFHSHLRSVNSVYSPRNAKKLTRNFAIGISVLTLVLLVTPWQQFSRGTGRVLAYNPNDRVQQVTATVSGLVEEWLVQDGQFVKKGDPIVRVVDNDPDYLRRLEAQRDAAVAKFEAVKEASNTARLNFHRQEKLVKEGLSSRKEFEQSKIKYKKLLSDEASTVADLAKAEVELARQQQQVVSAPRDGQILRILKGSGTTNVKVGEPLVDFVPQTEDHAVELFIDGNDLPLVFPGRQVRLQFEGWPAIQFSGWPSVAVGSFGGIVTVVDPSVSKNGTFRVLIKPDPDDPNDWPEDDILRQGTRVVGIIILDEVSIGYELWRQINGFPKSMDAAPKNMVKDKQ